MTSSPAPAPEAPDPDPEPEPSAAAADGRRERRRLRTAHALQAAALELFERQGFDATSTDEIAAAADVSPRTFFRYFPTKESVAFFDEYGEVVEEVLADADLDTSSPHAFVRDGILRVFAAIPPTDEEVLARRVRVIFSTPSLLGHLAADLANERARLVEGLGDRFPDLTPVQAESVAGAAIGVVAAVLERWGHHGGDLAEQLLAGLDVTSFGFAAAT